MSTRAKMVFFWQTVIGAVIFNLPGIKQIFPEARFKKTNEMR
jgi:hypothetical protein